MWQAVVSALGGSFILHYLKNFVLKEKTPFSWDWDGLLERAIITYLWVTSQWLYLIPAVIILKIIYRLTLIGFFENLSKINEPGTVSQKVTLKAELAFDLLLSPACAVLVGVIFK